MNTIATMTNDQATEAMIRIASATSTICEDSDVQTILNDLSNSKDQNIIVAIPKFLPRIVTLAFKKHKGDLYELVSAMSQTPVSEVGKLTFGETVDIIKANVDVLKGFFTL